MMPEDEVKLFSLQESISKGTYNPVEAEEYKKKNALRRRGF